MLFNQYGKLQHAPLARLWPSNAIANTSLVWLCQYMMQYISHDTIAIHDHSDRLQRSDRYTNLSIPSYRWTNYFCVICIYFELLAAKLRNVLKGSTDPELYIATKFFSNFANF